MIFKFFFLEDTVDIIVPVLVHRFEFFDVFPRIIEIIIHSFDKKAVHDIRFISHLFDTHEHQESKDEDVVFYHVDFIEKSEENDQDTHKDRELIDSLKGKEKFTEEFEYFKAI